MIALLKSEWLYMTAYWVLASIGVLLFLLIQGKISPAVLFTSWAVALVLLGVTEQQALLNSFSNSALITLVVLMLVSLALERSPRLDRLSDALLKGASLWPACA